MDLRGWITDAYESTTLIEWIGEDLQRARIVASLAGIGSGPPSDVVQFLLTDYRADDQVSSSLHGGFVSGFWWGNESNRLNSQIEQLNTWIDDPNLWRIFAGGRVRLSRALTRRLEVVLVEEAEEGR